MSGATFRRVCVQHRGSSSRMRGFSLVEIMVTVSVAVILAAIAAPTLRNTIENYRLRNAVGAVTGSIQATRYRAISSGYPFQIAVNKATSSFQIASDPNYTGTFTNIGSATPFSSSVTVSQDTILRFSPGGSVQASGATAPCPSGTPPAFICMTMAFGGKTETIAVSGYGKINVIP